MTQPLISIIVPCYNQAQYLDECLQSVIGQTYQKWECIIVDDGSPDHTEEIAKSWAERNSRFRYFKKENGGVSAARNFGIDKAEGEWILPLDGDDRIGNLYLEKAAQNMSSDVELIYCNAEFFGTEKRIWNLPDYSFKEILKHNLIFCSAFYRKSSFLMTGGYDTDMIKGFEDWEFWINLLHPRTKVLKLDYTGFFYRRKEVSRDTMINNDTENLKKIENYIYRKHSEKYTAAYGNFFDMEKEIQSAKDEIENLKYHNARLLKLADETFLQKVKRKIFKQNI
ncbi:glycosyltransferase family 2 protein [Chryseobacterium caseinilyticum]|uniref:Glycosyltransferase n=1 Tax=Chryseobacterium caseinilyticum TaxID=2771428 RepID=A0ABR8ZG77_9FLAO|nr:glycosyltransferase [Chryseobacterium caseinilyticum]MBD8084305.1 glycosyltransferase [Chryseobacterium caseinilyticum]